MKIIPFKNKRWQIIDDTGKVIDDAQGYGFKTEAAAKKCYHFKQFAGNNLSKIKDFKKKIALWWKEHPDIEEEIFFIDKDPEMLDKVKMADKVKILENWINTNDIQSPEGIFCWQLIYYF